MDRLDRFSLIERNARGRAFQATSCSNFGCVAAQQYPALLATLTVPGPDSAGSAF
jgi:hypothetical protein